MKRAALILWLISILSLVSFGVIFFIIGGWLNFLYILLGLSVAGFVGAVTLDAKFYWSLLSFRSTKSSLQVGHTILIAFAFLFFINFLSTRYNFEYDITPNRVNSLSERTQKIIEDLKSPISLKVFYSDEPSLQKKAEVSEILKQYKSLGSHIKVSYHNSYNELELAEKYLSETDKGFTFLVVSDFSAPVRVAEPYDESAITSSILKTQRTKKKHIAFWSGHGEASLKGKQNSFSILAAELRNLSFEVSEFNLTQGGSFPKEADVIAIIDPKSHFFQNELELLSTYLKGGGSVFMALESSSPGAKDLADILSVELQKGFLVNDFIKASGRGRGGTLGLLFDKEHMITKGFRSGSNFVYMDKATAVNSISHEELEFLDLMKAAPNTYLVSRLSEKKEVELDQLYNLAVLVKLKKSKQTMGIVLGDADFVKNDFIETGLNKNFALNSINFLAEELSLVSIAPRSPEKTELVLTSVRQNSLILVGIFLPLLFLVLAVSFWYKKNWSSQGS